MRFSARNNINSMQAGWHFSVPKGNAKSIKITVQKGNVLPSRIKGGGEFSVKDWG